MKIGVVDNYDSFTYNLVHYLEDILGEKPGVWMNDRIDWDELKKCSHLVLSPGPGLPSESGELMQVLETCSGNQKILGVCLGMQALAEFSGGTLKNLEMVQHGVESRITITQFAGNKLYEGLPETITVGRYHSWVVDELPAEWIITSEDESKNIMSMQHAYLPLTGVQYHPESIMTPHGKQILKNWIRL